MFKQILGRMLGYEQEIEKLKEQVDQLSWDTSFGMWTRGAFLQFCHIMPRGTRIVAFIDLNKIHSLNESLGYDEVDRRVNEAFAIRFRRSDVVARWFSGDEIVILFDSDLIGAERKVEELQASARKQGLDFMFEIAKWEVGRETIEEIVKVLGEGIARQKSQSDR